MVREKSFGQRSEKKPCLCKPICIGEDCFLWHKAKIDADRERFPHWKRFQDREMFPNNRRFQDSGRLPNRERFLNREQFQDRKTWTNFSRNDRDLRENLEGWRGHVENDRYIRWGEGRFRTEGQRQY